MFDAIPTSPFRLDRALRLEDLLISAAAIPLPTNPVAVPIVENDQDALTESSAADQQTNHAEAKETPSQPATESAQHQESQHDGLSASLQASIDAIHQSLAQDMPAASSSDDTARSATDHVAEADATEMTGSHSVTTAEHITADTTTVSADTTASSGSGASVAQIGQAASGAVATADFAAASALHETADLTATLSGTIANVTGALTVPSLHGVGIDSLVGLVQPISVPLALVSSIADATATSIDHPILSAPIGLEDLHHVDSAPTHLIHPVASLVGSGLI